YRRRDIRQMERLILRSENLGEFKDILFDRRNGEWLPKIENLIAEGPVFIAVGAGHLLSDRGLIELLREKGYAVEPVEFWRRPEKRVQRKEGRPDCSLPNGCPAVSS